MYEDKHLTGSHSSNTSLIVHILFCSQHFHSSRQLMDWNVANAKPVIWPDKLYFGTL